MPVFLPVALLGIGPVRAPVRLLVVLLVLLLVPAQALSPQLDGIWASAASLLPWLRLQAPVEGAFLVHQPWTTVLLHDQPLVLLAILWLWWPLAGAVEARLGSLGLLVLLAVLGPATALPVLTAEGQLPATGLALPVLALGFWLMAAQPQARLQCWLGLWLGPWALGRTVTCSLALPMLAVLLLHWSWLLALVWERPLLRPDPGFYLLHALAAVLAMMLGLITGLQARGWSGALDDIAAGRRPVTRLAADLAVAPPPSPDLALALARRCIATGDQDTVRMLRDHLQLHQPDSPALVVLDRWLSLP